MSEIVLQRRGPVAHIVLNRPDRLNAIGPPMLAELRAAILAIEASDARAVVFRGEGRAFSAGADLHALVGITADRVEFAAFMDSWHATFDAIAACPRPTIAAVHGIAFAGGFELLQVCDLAVVADDARLGDQHARFGLFPGGGSTQRLTRLIGERRAKWLLLSGEEISPADAVAFGLANEVVPADQVVRRADEIADLLASRSPAQAAAVKSALVVGDGLDVDTALAKERSIALEHMASDDAIGGIAAFQQRRLPVFADPIRRTQ